MQLVSIGKPNLSAENRRIKLQKLLVVALLLVVLPTVVVQAWLLYRTAHSSSVKFQEQVAGEVSARVFDKVLQFFDVPNRMVRYSAEQFRAGLLDTKKTEEMQTNFLLQLVPQPLLTFVSIGTANGEYYAASRPPQGSDRALRLLQATESGQRIMSLYNVNANNQRGSIISKGNLHFDARTRPWFKAAQGYNRARWYPAYRYAIADPNGAYDALGIGMAAPLYDGKGDFVGVVTADVALVQLSNLLSSITKDLGGTAFLFDEGGDLLATSTLEPIYQLADNNTVRVKAVACPNVLIRDASKAMAGSAEPRGRTVRVIDGESYLLDWRQYPLPDGPMITIANMLPQSRFDTPARNLLYNVLLLATCVILVSVLLTIIVSRWIAKPLIDLGEWATRLGRGEWQTTQHRASPISEVESLSNALRFMADSLKYHTDNLEKEVAARTAELELANIELARRSNTDGLTGVANRRHFDEILELEVARARRHAEPIALIMLDVDHFKEFNDQYGHLAGDRCLIEVAAILEANMRRPGDLAARFGGEEFAIILAKNDMKQAHALAEILRRQIEELAIAHVATGHGWVTVSLGVAVVVPDKNNGAAELIEMADMALYRAKKKGRNRVEPSGTLEAGF